MQKFLFLLGGKDLEMLEIEKILRKFNNEDLQIKIENMGLNWSGASWNAYKEVIKKYDDDYTIVGIELFDREAKPANAVDINHHNQRRCEPSSIEQVARLLDVN